MAICPGCGRDHGSRTVSHGTRYTESYTPPQSTSDPKYPNHTFSSRQAVDNQGSFIGKTSYIHNEKRQLVVEKLGKNGNVTYKYDAAGHIERGADQSRSTGFFQGLFNWLAK